MLLWARFVTLKPFPIVGFERVLWVAGKQDAMRMEFLATMTNRGEERILRGGLSSSEEMLDSP